MRQAPIDMFNMAQTLTYNLTSRSSLQPIRISRQREALQAITSINHASVARESMSTSTHHCNMGSARMFHPSAPAHTQQGQTFYEGRATANTAPQPEQEVTAQFHFTRYSTLLVKT